MTDKQLQAFLATLTKEEKELYLDRLNRNPWMLYQPQPIQEAFHKSEKKTRFFFGGNRAGKTRALVQEVIWWLTGLHPYRKVPKPCDIWVVSIDFPASRDVVQPIIRKLLGTAYLKSWHETDKIITSTSGSTIGFKSCDSGWDRFQGTAKHLIAFDEEPDYSVYQECLMRTVSTKGSVICAMTPTHGMSWTYDMVYEPWKDGTDKTVECFNAPTKSNKYIDQDEVTRITRSFSDEEKSARLEGQFVQLSGLIYKEFKPETHVVSRFPIPDHWIKVRGIDPGLHNPTGVVWIAVSPDDELFVYDELYCTDMTIQEYSTAIKAKTGQDKISYTVIDPASCSRNPAHPELKSVREEYQKYGVWTKPGNNDVAYGINAVKELLRVGEFTQKPKLYIFEDCMNLRKEMGRYRWDTHKYDADDKNKKERPRKMMDHLLDALRYVVASHPHYVAKSQLLEIATQSFKPTRS